MANSAEEWVSLSAFARQRGVTLHAVQKAIESGRVTAVRRDDKGRLVGIEVAAATMQWDVNTDPVEAAKNGKVLGQVSSAEALRHARIRRSAAGGIQGTGANTNAVRGDERRVPADASGDADLIAQAAAGSGTPEITAAAAAAPATRLLNKDPHGYYQARGRREEFQSKQAELEYLQALGELVSSNEIRRISARRYRAMRDKLLNIADRVAAVVAAEREPAQVHAILTADIKRVLNELSDDASAELAAGVAERVVT